MRKSEKKLRVKLLKRALDLAQSGISVIPVQGDSSPQQPKRPAIKWRPWQRRIMNEAELRSAFAGDASALGIVCGRVSGLLVVDFDDHLRYRRFCRHLPRLAASYTVKTRRGYHVYFRTSERVPSHQFDGGDIKGERSYVVAPPSVIAGFAYKRMNCAKVLQLEKLDLDRLLNHFHEKGLGHQLAVQSVAAELDLAALYRRLAPRIGRNKALYRAASVGRDRGMTAVDVEGRLNALHAIEVARSGHKPENYSERLREAAATVASAFSRGYGYSGEAGLPNSVREKLLAEQRSTVLSRLLDAMALAGWQAESCFSMSQAVELGGRYGLNRKSVMAGLTGEFSIFDGRHIIARRYVEYLDIGGLNAGRRGRPVELIFQTPSAGRLLAVLKLGATPSDRLTAGDLKSAHAYRLALHREYIRRLTPRTSLKFLADRLGVDPRTVRRYNRELSLKSTACVARLELTWQRLFCLPKRARRDVRSITPGYWLETRDGYRAPAWRHIGAALLKRGETGLQVCMQRVSKWSSSRESVAAVRYERVSVEEFLRLRALRHGKAEAGVLRRGLGKFLHGAKMFAGRIAYEKLRLSFDSVAARIAEDKTAESIAGFLFARDLNGQEVRRPARRGIAYRMLKEFGEGNVFLALRHTVGERLASVSGEFPRDVELLTSGELLAPAML